MSKNLIKPKKDCNCKTREEISNITRMIDDDVLTEMKKQNKFDENRAPKPIQFNELNE